MESIFTNQHPEQGGGAARTFSEEEWLKLLFACSDLQAWMDEFAFRLFGSIPITDRKKLFRSTYYLTPAALAHILERHYYKIPRHPGTGKFTIPVTNILHWLREAGAEPATPLPGTLNYKRIFKAPSVIGFDQQGQPTCFITILTDSGGKILTAFPGIM